jgi:peptidoglycan/LPS O-acetylase OafA/YrhL
MIQRIQSVWLLLASITIFLLLAIPVASSVKGGKEFWVQATGLFQQENGVTTKVDTFTPLFICVIAVGLMCIAVIFSYTKRSLQKKLCIALMAMVALLTFWTFNYVQKIPGELANVTYNAGIALPILAIVFCALAVRGITKDEQLLRSADRLR